MSSSTAFNWTPTAPTLGTATSYSAPSTSRRAREDGDDQRGDRRNDQGDDEDGDAPANDPDFLYTSNGDKRRRIKKPTEVRLKTELYWKRLHRRVPPSTA